MNDAQETLIPLDTETGALECPYCKENEDNIAGLERDIRAWRTRYAELKRDKEEEAQNSPYWREAKEVFDYWREKCKHKGSKFAIDRYELILPFLKKDGVELCKRAIDGAAYDPMTQTRKNGTTERFDSLELIFRNRGKFESFCNRAPLELYTNGKTKTQPA